MSFHTEKKQLNKKLDLFEDLLSIERRETALKEMISILEEKLAVEESTLTPAKSLEWVSSPETVRELYTS